MDRIHKTISNVTSSLQVLQPYLTTQSSIPLNLELMVACLAGCVLRYSDLQRCLSGVTIDAHGATLWLSALKKLKLFVMAGKFQTLDEGLRVIVDSML